MPDYELLFEQINTKYYNKLAKVCRPLNDLFETAYFSYQKIDLDGNYRLLGNHPDFLGYYLDKKWYLEDPFLISPNCYTSGTSVFNLTDDFEKLDEPTKITLTDMEIQFGFSRSILFLTKKFESYEIFFFSLSEKNKNNIKLFYKYFHLIEKYFSYFRQKMQNELHEIDEMNINIAAIRNTNFTIANDSTLQAENERKFIEHITNEEFELIKIIKSLSNREVDCLYWLIQGKTAKETAIILNISSRTVEIHREKCRMKFNNISLYNLIYKIGKYELLDFLSYNKAK